MLVKELIRHLRTFDVEHFVEIEIYTECDYLKVKTTIDDVQYKNGNCVLYGQD